MNLCDFNDHTVDGKQKSGLHQLRLVVYPIIYMFFVYMPGGDRRISSIKSIWVNLIFPMEFPWKKTHISCVSDLIFPSQKGKPTNLEHTNDPPVRSYEELSNFWPKQQ